MRQERSLDQPAISVCIANYNGIDIIADCIDSVVNQSFSGSYEILVHDDASQDDSVEFIRTTYPDITLIQSTMNVGFCKSNNRLAETAKGKYLLFLNNDVVLFDNALEKMLQEAEQDSGDSILSVSQIDINTNKTIDHGYFLDPFFNPIPNLDEKIKNVAMVIGACLWISRIQWDRASGFPEWFDTLAEDMYLCMFAIVNGQNVRVVGNSGYKHHVGYSLGGGKVKNNSLSTSFKRRRFSERNKTYVLCLFTPKIVLLPILCVHLIALVCEGAILSLIKMDKKLWGTIYLFTLTSLWKNRKILFRERKRVQQFNKISLRYYLSIFRWYPHKIRLLLSHGVPSIR